MSSKSSRLSLILWPLSIAPAYSAAIQNLTFTDIVKDVTVINVATKEEKPAKPGDVLVPPNVLKTGPDSRAELIAEDKTVTRVGANTVFSIEADSRDVNLTQGSVLFNSPKGKGGGRIKSAGATASVLGTTLIVGANPAGGFKVMLLEGKGQVTGAKGGAAKLSPGQMSFAMPGKPPTPPLNFELKGSVSGSKLVGGFSKPLASIAKIEAAVNVQQSKIASGELQTTGLALGDQPGVAIKVDAAVLSKVNDSINAMVEKTVQRVVEQLRIEEETKVAGKATKDQRLLLALNTPNLLLANPNPTDTSTPKSVTLKNQVAPEELIFTISGTGTSIDDNVVDEKSGLTKSNNGAGTTTMKSVPRADASGSGTTSMLIAPNITLNLNSVVTTSEIFLHSPVSTKDATAIVALEKLKIDGSVDFSGFDNVRMYPSLNGASTTEGSEKVQLTSVDGLMTGMAIAGAGIPEGAFIGQIDTAKNTISLVAADGTRKLTATQTASGINLFGYAQVDATLGATTASVVASTLVGLHEGMTVKSNLFPDGTKIVSIASNGVVTFDNPAVATGRADIYLEGVTSGTPLILSAGNTIEITPGSRLRVATATLDMFTAGTSFQPDLSVKDDVPLKVSSQDTPKTRLSLERIFIENEWPLEGDSATGRILMKAPHIDITNSKVKSGLISLQSTEGDINIVGSSFKGTVTRDANSPDVSKLTVTAEGGFQQGQIIIGDRIPEGTVITEIKEIPATTESPKKYELTLNARVEDLENTDGTTSNAVGGIVSGLPLGIRDPLDLAIQSYVLSMESAQNISLSNVPLYTVDATFNANGNISISGVTFGSMNPVSGRDSDSSTHQKIRATSTTGNILIEKSLATYAYATELSVLNGGLTVKDPEFGSHYADTLQDITLNENSTSFKAVALKTMLLAVDANKDLKGIWADRVELTSGDNLTLTGKVIGSDEATLDFNPTDSAKGTFTATSKSGGVTLSYASINHSIVNITAGGDLILPLRGVRDNAVTDADADWSKVDEDGTKLTAAQRKCIIDLINVPFSKADRVALDATTVVLKDVSFKDGSSVFLNSHYGRVAAYPGMGEDAIKPASYKARVPGYVNFHSNVFYGGTEIKLPNASLPMNNAAFQAEATRAGKDLSKITIGYQTGNAASVTATPASSSTSGR